MGAQQRVFKQKINSTQSLRKIFKAMELIAASRIQKAIGRAAAASPYASAITRAVAAVATQSNEKHLLTSEPEVVRRAAVLVLTSDRGFAGAYSANVIREAEELVTLLQSEGKEVALYTGGRKAARFYTFRERPIAEQWEGFAENPSPADARAVGDRLVGDFTKEYEDGGVDEIYVVYTRFINSALQRPEYLRLLPLEVVDEDPAEYHDEFKRGKSDDQPYPLYEFEPDATTVLDSLLPRYIVARLFAAMLTANASEQAARQTAMKTASDNADDLIKNYTRLANSARQAEITQELTEIVGGADALAASSNAD